MASWFADLLSVTDKHGFIVADLHGPGDGRAEHFQPNSSRFLFFERPISAETSREALRHALVLDACGVNVRAQTLVSAVAAADPRFGELAAGAYLRAARIGGFATTSPLADLCRSVFPGQGGQGRDHERYPVLISIHLQTNNPANFIKFCDRLANSCDDPRRIEVVVKIDDDHAALNELLPLEVARQPFKLKYISTPLLGGFFALWESMNDMLEVTDPGAYFLLNVNDEMYFRDHGWDSRLERYVGLFTDDLYRLRTSVYRHRIYHDHWECGFAPETSAITTKRWILTGGNWNPCLGPDTFQQCVAYYFGLINRHLSAPRYREIPIDDIRFGGEGAYIGLEGKALRRRVRGATRAWFRLMSPQIQQEAARRAAKIHATITAAELGLDEDAVRGDLARRSVLVVKGEQSVAAYSYAISWWRYRWLNLSRVTRFPAMGGGGQHASGNPFLVTLGFLALRYDWADRLRDWFLDEAIPPPDDLRGVAAQTRYRISRITRRGVRIGFLLVFFAPDVVMHIYNRGKGSLRRRLVGVARKIGLGKSGTNAGVPDEQLER